VNSLPTALFKSALASSRVTNYEISFGPIFGGLTLADVGLVKGLQKFSEDKLKQKASNPKLQVFNTALISAQSHLSFKEMKQDKEAWKNLVKCSIGGHILNSILGTRVKVFYWKEGGNEIDFVVRKDKTLLTITVNDDDKKQHGRAIEEFSRLYHPQQNLFVGKGGIPVDKFLLTPLELWIESASEHLRESA